MMKSNVKVTVRLWSLVLYSGKGSTFGGREVRPDFAVCIWPQGWKYSTPSLSCNAVKNLRSWNYAMDTGYENQRMKECKVLLSNASSKLLLSSWPQLLVIIWSPSSEDRGSKGNPPLLEAAVTDVVTSRLCGLVKVLSNKHSINLVISRNHACSQLHVIILTWWGMW
jgi:hypothetical protein